MLVDVLAATMCISCALLVAAGIAKFKDPSGTVVAVRSVELPASATAIRAFALAEVGLGAYWLLTGSVLAAGAVGLVYVLFAGFGLLTLRRLGPNADCGCFGRQVSPLSWPHIAFTAGAAAIAIAAAVGGSVPSLTDLLSDDAAEASIELIGLAGATYFAYALLTVGAQLVTQIQGRRPDDGQIAHPQG